MTEILSTTIALTGITSFFVSVFVWKYLVPRETNEGLQKEIARQRDRIADRDRELQEFRQQRQADLLRLERDEENLETLDQEVTELRAWRYGAERYIRALESLLRRHNLTVPNRLHYGINGENKDEE